jgi:hypothetical protein
LGLVFWAVNRPEPWSAVWLVITALWAVRLVGRRWDRVEADDAHLAVRRTFRRRSWAWSGVDRVEPLDRNALQAFDLKMWPRTGRAVSVDLLGRSDDGLSRTDARDAIVAWARAAGVDIGPRPLSDRVRRRQLHNVPTAPPPEPG